MNLNFVQPTGPAQSLDLATYTYLALFTFYLATYEIFHFFCKTDKIRKELSHYICTVTV